MKPVDDARSEPCPCLVVEREQDTVVYKCEIASRQPEEGYWESCRKDDAITCPRFLSMALKLRHYQL